MQRHGRGLVDGHDRLPLIAEKATGRDRAFLLSFIRHMSSEAQDDRPSFAELVKRIDLFQAHRDH